MVIVTVADHDVTRERSGALGDAIRDLAPGGVLSRSSVGEDEDAAAPRRLGTVEDHVDPRCVGGEAVRDLRLAEFRPLLEPTLWIDPKVTHSSWNQTFSG